jgi:acetyl esterase
MDPKQLSRQLGIDEGDGGRGRGDPIRKSIERFRRQVTREAVATISEVGFQTLSSIGRLHPLADPARHQVQLISDIPYKDTGSAWHTLDIYKPTVRPGPWPVVFYVHGGGFRLLSKDTHWVMGLVFARFGYLVVNVSYRLAPKHPFPNGLQDVCAAYEWTCKNIEAHGGDLSKMIFAGESAGGNLVSALTLASCYQRPEPWARAVYDLNVVPKATMPFCAILQVSDTQRFLERRQLPFWVRTVLHDVQECYLGRAKVDLPETMDLADPLLVIERGDRPDRPLPPFFLPVGTKDPLLDDTRRMDAALQRMGVASDAKYYPGELHAFHAMVWRSIARRCWRDAFAFLDKYVREQPRERLRAVR